MYGTPSIPLSDLEVFADGLDHPESVTWGSDGYVYAGGEAGQVYRVDLESGETTLIGTTGGFLLGVVVDGDGNVYGCDMANHAVMRVTPAGEVSVYSSGTAERAMNCPNAGVFDARGNLYVADSGDWRGENGCIWRIAPGGETELFADDVRAHSNGVALSPDGAYLYCVESLRPALMRTPLGADGRAAGPSEVALPFDPGLVVDGVQFDREGGIILSCYSPDSIYRLAPDGMLTLLAHDVQRVVLASPANTAFAGPDLTTLVVSSLARWHLAKFAVEVPGNPLHYPKGISA